MPYETAELRARALVARALSATARDTQVANLLVHVANNLDLEACERERNLLNALEEGWPEAGTN